MDQATIKERDIAARYLSGELTVREAREFEKFCLAHPDLVATLPIPVRLKARLGRHRLTEEEEQALAATAIPHAAVEDAELAVDDEPTSVTLTADRPLVLYSLAAALVLAVAASAVFALRSDELAERVRALEEEARSMSLRAPSSLHAFRVSPDRSGPPANPQVAMRWPDPPQLLELSIDVSQGRYAAFAITIDKVDEARILQIRRIAADTNRELRLGLNSSAFGPGTYDLQIQGYTWRGELVDYGWVRLQLLE